MDYYPQRIVAGAKRPATISKFISDGVPVLVTGKEHTSIFLYGYNASVVPVSLIIRRR